MTSVESGRMFISKPGGLSPPPSEQKHTTPYQLIQRALDTRVTDEE